MKKHEDPIWSDYKAAISAVSKEECSQEIVQRAKYALCDLLQVQAANNEGCLISGLVMFILCVVATVGTMAAALVAFAYAPGLLSLIDMLDATTAPGWVTDAVAWAIYIALIAIVMVVFTLPVERFILKGWMRRKIRRLKRAIAKMPKELVRGWSFMEPDRFARRP